MNFAKFLRAPFPTEHLRWLFVKPLNIRTQKCEINLFAKIANGFQQKASSQIFEWALKTPLAKSTYSGA